MKIDDVKKIDWKQDPDLLAVERKMAGLAERETKERSRLAELERIVSDGEPSLLQARAAEMLGEPSDEAADEIQERLNSARREIVDLHANSEALKLAQKRLEPAVEAAKSAAKLRVAKTLAPLYLATAEALKTQLAKASELNEMLHAIYSQSIKCDLRRETHGIAELKPLGFTMAWNALRLPGGQPSAELSFWRGHVDKFIDAN